MAVLLRASSKTWLAFELDQSGSRSHCQQVHEVPSNPVRHEGDFQGDGCKSGFQV